LNNCKKISLSNAALGKEAGIASLIVTDREGRALGGASRVARSKSQQERTVEVPIVAIDTVCKDRDVSIIHVDCEGYEAEAIMGGIETIRILRPIVVAETNPKSLSAVIEIVQGLGYHSIGTVHQNIVLVPKGRSVRAAKLLTHNVEATAAAEV
jgi:hypothetical protein